jgi:hypothetical protein
MTSIGRHVTKLSGYALALPTPFDGDGNIDSAAFEEFCCVQIQQGATALVVSGTTGEDLSHVQRCARPVSEHVSSLPTRADAASRAFGKTDFASEVCAVSRNESRSAQIRIKSSRSDVAQGTFAAG